MKLAILLYDPERPHAVSLAGMRACSPDDVEDTAGTLVAFDSAAVVLGAEDAAGAAARAALGSSTVARRANGTYIAAVPLVNPISAADSSA